MHETLTRHCLLLNTIQLGHECVIFSAFYVNRLYECTNTETWTLHKNTPLILPG